MGDSLDHARAAREQPGVRRGRIEGEENRAVSHQRNDLVRHLAERGVRCREYDDVRLRHGLGGSGHATPSGGHPIDAGGRRLAVQGAVRADVEIRRDPHPHSATCSDDDDRLRA
jgi:hypothetical protein